MEHQFRNMIQSPLTNQEQQIANAMGNLWKTEHPEIITKFQTPGPDFLVVNAMNRVLRPYKAKFDVPEGKPVSFGAFVFESDEDMIHFLLKYGTAR